MRGDPPLTTNDLLIEAGAALYGPRWQSEIARDLGCTPRTVQRWANHQNPTPAAVIDDLRAILVARRNRIERLIEKLA